MPASCLRALQRHLERIYEIDVSRDCEVDRFLITDAGLAGALEGEASARALPEKLLVWEQAGELHVSLYLDPAVLEVLSSNDPIHGLNDDNLAAFWSALEGVSHFLYLVWNARHGRGISLFELELQAEVDKFVAAVFLLARQRRRRVPRDLHEHLFARPVFDPRLVGGEWRRYRHANHFAGLYCARLRRRYLANRGPGLVRDLRRFYRLTHRHKLDHIRAAAG
ncbi:MAG: hypothetical protein IT489_06895 [Gammaproteobacteria bacterium]|nr:hypothetical protein [Gammaproteobacteria bacterium]